MERDFELRRVTLRVPIQPGKRTNWVQARSRAPSVDDLMRLLKENCCPPEEEFAVQVALREAITNAVVHGNAQDPSKKVRICCACDAKGESSL